MDVDEDQYVAPERPAKRFKHRSYKETLKQVHLTPAILQTQLDHEIADNDSHFHTALSDWRELNLAPAFLRFVNKADPLSSSIALLVHHWKEITDLWLEAVDGADDEALKPLLDLLQKLIHDLRTTITPAYPQILTRLLSLLPRSLAAETFSILLPTFTSFFKYVLLPIDATAKTVDVTWTAFSDVLPTCDPEVQRAVAEVWGNTLRRMKAESRERCVARITESASPDVGAWVFVCACKSVSQTLHTSTPSIIRPLLQFHLSTAPNSEASTDSFTVIRRVLTALAHHCKTAEQYSPVTDILLEYLTNVTAIEGSTSQSEDDVGRLLEVITVPCSVRNGSRISPKHHAVILAKLQLIPLSTDLHASHLKISTACLMAGDMALWMGPGRKIFERVWIERAGLALQLTGALLELGWGGWQMIALPHVVKRSLELLEKDDAVMKVLEMLSAAQKEGKLTAVDDRWKDRLRTWVFTRFEHWTAAEQQIFELQHVIALSGLIPDFGKVLAGIIKVIVSDPEHELRVSSPWALGASMACLAHRPSKEWRDELNLIHVAEWIIEREEVATNGFVLDGLVKLAQNTSIQHDMRIEFQVLYHPLQASIGSHSRLTRLSALRLLSSPLIAEPGSDLGGAAEMVKRCLQGEEVSVDVQGVRERVLHMKRLNHLLRDNDEVGASLSLRWLVAQFKINLRPLWSAAAEAIAIMSERKGISEIVWRLIFEELKQGSEPPSDLEWPDPVDDESDTINESERTWRDPSAHKIRSAINIWLGGSASQRAIHAALHVEGRYDANNYELQLLTALSVAPALAEKHNRELVPYFLSFVSPEEPTKALARSKLAAWLTLFSKFSNPKALYSTQDMRLLYTTLLSHPDRQLQRLALDCTLTFKEPPLIKFEEQFKALLDATRWRDELTGLDIANIDGAGRNEIIGVLIRLLYGVMLEKKGKSRSKGGLDRRAAVLSAFAGCTNDELNTLVDLMLGPILSQRENAAGSQEPSDFGKEYQIKAIPDTVSDKQLVGFLTLLGDVMKNLGTKLLARWNTLLQVLLDIIGYAQGRLTASATAIGYVEESGGSNEEDTPSDPEDEDEQHPSGTGRAIRAVRQTGLRRFIDFFRSPVALDFDFTPYLPEAFRAFISPRLPLLSIENTQAPSALLELFHTWSLKPHSVRYLVAYDDLVLPKVYDCLVANSVKPAVISKVFDVIEHLLDLAQADESILESVLKPGISHLLTNLTSLVERMKGDASLTDQLGRRQINILSQLAPYMADSSQASALLSLFTPILRKPSKMIPEKLKVDIINIIRNLLPLVSGLSSRESAVYMKTYSLFAYLLQSLRSRQARLAVVAAFQAFAQLDTSLQRLTDLLESLNSYSSRRMEEPDFDRRLTAFATLNDTLYESLTAQEWLPILHNVLNFIQDPDELSIRTNSSASMKRFIDRAANHRADYEATFIKVLYPGLKNGLRSRNELVRAELLSVLSYSIQQCEHIAALQEMRPLLAAGDEEASFFNNVLHVQTHRRTRALRRLVDFCNEAVIKSTTLSDIFVPLVGTFITEGLKIDHHLLNESITTLGHIARHLHWGAYHALIQQYLRLSRKKDESERLFIRTLVSILDNFHFPMDVVVEVSQPPQAVDADDLAPEEEPEETTQLLDADAKQRSLIADVVNTKLLPSLLQHLEKRDETEDTLRIPISIGIVQVAKHLPVSARDTQISRLIVVISQIFRSKSQETRDLSRDTLCKIAVILGPSYLPEILRELRTALTRGPHLHILAYVAHALVVHVTSDKHISDFAVLDECVNDVAHVSAEVIFGESGKDVQSEDFKTKIREVRLSSAKGLDSFSIIAKHITPPKISSLLVPIRNILQHTETLKVMQQVEDLLRRIAGGLNANQHVTPVDLLALCHTLISQNARFLKVVPKPQQATGKAKTDAVVEKKRHLIQEADHYANNSFTFIVFGLELFNTAHRRGRFDFQDSAVIARLEPMVPVIGNTLYSKHMQVLIPGLKAATAIVKCPLKSIPKSLPVFIRQMIDIVKQTGSTESDVVQAAFKSLATVLRDQPTAQVKEKDLVFLLELLSPDLEEPERQTSVFTMLRAIVARKFVVPEIYDLMDRVSEIMVTNQSSQVQELCRGVLLQFLLEYPQGKGRLRNSMTFFAKNLSYVHESGRKSVMELLNAILSKFDPALIQEYSDLLFVALVMVIANDDSSKCREMASELIKNLFAKLEGSQRRVVMSHIHSWASQRSQPQLARVSSQVYSILIDYLQGDAAPYIASMLEDLGAIITVAANNLEEATGADETTMDLDIEWQVPYHALTTLAKLLRITPEVTVQSDKVPWSSVVSLLLFPHAWVRTASCRLLGLLFAAVPAAAPSPNLPEDSPFSVIGMEDIAKKLCLQLRSENLDAALGVQVVKNLFYIGKCFHNLETMAGTASTQEKDDDYQVDENDEEDNENEQDADEPNRHPLSWLFSKLSYQARSAHIARRNKSSSTPNWFEQPASVLRWFAAMVSFLEAPQVEKFLVHILSPLYRIAEDDTIRDAPMEELKTLSIELQDLVQSRVGTTAFATVYNKIRQNVLGVQRERRTARVVQAAANPELASKRKIHRNVAKKESRKRKGDTFVEGRGRVKRTRDH